MFSNLHLNETSRRQFLTSLSSLAAFSLAGCRQSVDLTGAAQLLIEKFPRKLEGARSIKVYPCDEPAAVLVHIRQIHNTPFSLQTGESENTRTVQSNIWRIVTELKALTGLTYYISEGLDKKAFAKIKPQLSEFESASSSRRKIIIDRLTETYGSDVATLAQLMTDNRFKLLPVQENMSTDLKAKYDELSSDRLKLFRMNRIRQEYLKFMMDNGIGENSLADGQRRFPQIDEARIWIEQNGERIVVSSRTFLKEHAKEMIDDREEDVIQTALVCHKESADIQAIGCIFGANHSFVTRGARAKLAVIEVTPYGVQEGDNPSRDSDAMKISK